MRRLKHREHVGCRSRKEALNKFSFYEVLPGPPGPPDLVLLTYEKRPQSFS
ncbi:hypothetical protein POPTR_011G073141v4 [Populus trichocarpa]|uniref:Uncharacterized protein n=1 Tax=Populus trichocarpa TaxID=3694 RepID=A0ACC0S7U9_POPTR|nr:hypothetical protein POPTR_011G073141v4 [Populus trichocarpa]